jgi:hypothetical protein
VNVCENKDTCREVQRKDIPENFATDVGFSIHQDPTLILRSQEREFFFRWLSIIQFLISQEKTALDRTASRTAGKGNRDRTTTTPRPGRKKDDHNMTREKELGTG